MSEDTKLSIKLAIAAAAVAIFAILIVNLTMVLYSISALALIVLSAITAFITFATAYLGLKLKRKHQFSKVTLMVTGGLFGLCAYLIIAGLSLILTISPTYYDRFAATLLTISFSLGGFLGPLLGAIIGFREPKSSSANKA